jgi:hypothetical protein
VRLPYKPVVGVKLDLVVFFQPLSPRVVGAVKIALSTDEDQSRGVRANVGQTESSVLS